MNHILFVMNVTKSWNGARGLGDSGGQTNETAMRKERTDVQELRESPDEVDSLKVFHVF